MSVISNNLNKHEHVPDFQYHWWHVIDYLAWLSMLLGLRNRGISLSTDLLGMARGLLHLEEFSGIWDTPNACLAVSISLLVLFLGLCIGVFACGVRLVSFLLLFLLILGVSKTSVTSSVLASTTPDGALWGPALRSCPYAGFGQEDGW